jgi:hypothetical protein
MLEKRIKETNKERITDEAMIYLLPRVRFDLRKLELGVIGIHFANLLSGRCAQDFDNLHQLVDAGVAREYGLAKKKLGQHTSSAPNI